MIEVPQGAISSPRGTLLAAALLVAVVSGCASSGGSQTQASTDATSSTTAGGAVSSTTQKEPDRIVVQHILIGAEGLVRGKNITRNLDEAKTLAYQLLERARAGEDFDELVRAHTDDAFPGRYGMANRGITPSGPGEYGRDNMVPAFGNVGFTLAVGEVGIADYDQQTSPYGYHVIKRVQ
jgi:parvulin-like peptidyl-prolyl isomerase